MRIKIALAFLFFFILRVAAWGPWAQATPRMKKSEKQISLKTFDKTENLFENFWHKSSQSEVGKKFLRALRLRTLHTPAVTQNF